jgi:hypothetical protein
VDWSRRASASLRGLGFEEGVVPSQSQVSFEPDGKIAALDMTLLGCRADPRVRPAPPPRLEVDTRASPEKARIYSLSAQQARQVATVMGFVSAYDQGRVEDALAFVDPELGGISDCDYRAGVTVRYSAIEGAWRWLQERAADHDSFEVAALLNHNPAGGGLGIVWSRRSSDTLRQLGFRDGIKPQLRVMIAFTNSDRMMARFALSTPPESGGNQAECRPLAQTAGSGSPMERAET